MHYFKAVASYHRGLTELPLANTRRDKTTPALTAVLLPLPLTTLNYPYLLCTLTMLRLAKPQPRLRSLRGWQNWLAHRPEKPSIWFDPSKTKHRYYKTLMSPSHPYPINNNVLLDNRSQMSFAWLYKGRTLT